MRVLLTNDDGMQAEGIQALRTALLAVPGIDLLCIAPDGNRSAIGRGITTRRPQVVERIDFADGTHGFTTDGTPVDCVRLAGLGLVDDWSPEIVVAGVNHGANLGDDVSYSGTVAAAMEGIILGLPAIAVSQQSRRGDFDMRAGEGFDFDVPARFTARLVEELEEVPLPAGTLLNINCPAGEPSGVEVARLGRRYYHDTLRLDEDLGDGRRRFWIHGDEPTFDAEDDGTDLVAVAAGRIAVTPIHMDFTFHDGIGPLSASDLDRMLAPAASEVD